MNKIEFIEAIQEVVGTSRVSTFHEGHIVIQAFGDTDYKKCVEILDENPQKESCVRIENMSPGRY